MKSGKMSLTVAPQSLKLLGVMIICLALLPSVSAWSNNTFNNSLTSEFLNFIAPGSFIRYLSVPSGVIVTTANLNITYPSAASQSSLGIFANTKIYYDFSSGKDLVLGVNNLSNNQGTVAYNSSNCIIGNCAQISLNNNLALRRNNFMTFIGNNSINFWIRPSNSTPPVSDEYVFLSSLNASGRVSINSPTEWKWNSWFNNGVNTLTTRTPPTAAAYYMITITVQNDTMNNYTTYVNGLIENSSINGNVGAYGSIDWYLGTNFNNASDFLGQIDEFGVWNTTLNSSDIVSLYNSGAGITYTAPAPSTGNLNISIGTISLNSTAISNSSIAINASFVATGFQSTINNYVATCVLVSGVCNVPFNFSSSSSGVFILYNNLNFSNTLLLENSQTFQATVQELSSNSFSINETIDSSYYTSSSATLVYNNTRFAGTKTGTGNNLIFTRIITAPSVGASTNISFYWELSLNNGSTTSLFNSTFKNQTVTNVGVDDCASNTVVILNYTMYDEDTRVKIPASLNTSFEVTVNVGDQLLENAITTSFNKSNLNPVLVCIQNLTSTLRLDSTVKYSSDLRVIEYHNIQNYTLTNQSIPINISLYDLLITSSQEYLITFKDQNFIPVPNVLIDITRQYIPIGLFLTVEIPKTDNNGRTTGHFVSNDIVYTIYVRSQGQLLATFQNVQLFCASAVGDCRLNLDAQGSTTSPQSFTTNGNVSYRPFYNSSTRTYSFEFVSLDGIERLVSLNLTLFDNLNNQTLCSNSLSSSSGTVTCIIPSSVNGTAIAKVYINNILIMTDIFDIISTLASQLPSFRYLIAALIILTLPLIAISSPVAAIMLFIVGLIMSGTLIAIDWGGYIGVTTALLWFIIAALILLFIKDRRDNG